MYNTLHPANAYIQRCPRCQSPLNTVVVHGHEQCAVCKSNIFECCSGDTCDTDHNLSVGYKRGWCLSGRQSGYVPYLLAAWHLACRSTALNRDWSHEAGVPPHQLCRWRRWQAAWLLHQHPWSSWHTDVLVPQTWGHIHQRLWWEDQVCHWWSDADAPSHQGPDSRFQEWGGDQPCWAWPHIPSVNVQVIADRATPRSASS